MNLTDSEKALVRDLSRNPDFASIMRKFDEAASVPRFRKETKVDDEAQTRNWIRASGYRDAMDFVLIVLGYRNE